MMTVVVVSVTILSIKVSVILSIKEMCARILLGLVYGPALCKSPSSQ